jgi:hypothetical protein
VSLAAYLTLLPSGDDGTDDKAQKQASTRDLQWQKPGSSQRPSRRHQLLIVIWLVMGRQGLGTYARMRTLK